MGLRVAPEFHIEDDLRTGYLPGIAIAKPFVGDFNLPAIVNRLIEYPELIPDTVTDCRNLQGCQGVHEARREPTESTVSETRLLLLGQQFVEIESKFLNRLLDSVIDSEVDEVVSQMRSQQVLGRQVTDRSAPLVLVRSSRSDPVMEQAVSNRVGEGLVVVVRGSHFGEAPLHVKEIVEKRTFDGFDTQSSASRFRPCGCFPV